MPVFEITEILRPGEQRKVTVEDISRAGLRFFAPVPLPPRTVLKVRIDCGSGGLKLTHPQFSPRQ